MIARLSLPSFGLGLGFGLLPAYVRTYVRTFFLIRCPIAYTGLASASDSAIRTYAIRMYRRTYVRTCFFLLLPSIAYTASASKVFHRSSGEESGVSSALFQLTYVCTYIHVIRSGRTATGVPALKTSLPTPIEKRHREMSKQELEGILVLD